MNKLFNRYILSAALAASAMNANAGTNMTSVMERVEQKGLIRFTDLDAKNQALMAAYGHFMPFDKVTVTKEGKILRLTDKVIDDILSKGYGIRDLSGMPIAEGVDSMLTSGEDFYVAANNGSFKLVVDNANLVGTSDEEPKTPFIDFSINARTGEYFRKIADSRDAVATEGYSLFNIFNNPIEISVKGPKSLVTGILPDRLGSAIKTNSSREDVRSLVEELGLYQILDRAFEVSGQLGIDSETKLTLRRSGTGFDYALNVVNVQGIETTIEGRIEETSFWETHNMHRPSEDVTRQYLGLEEVVVAGKQDSTGVKEDSTGVKPSEDMRFTMISGAAYPLGAIAGIRGTEGRNFFEAYGGFTSSNGNTLPPETFTGQTTPVGRRIDIVTTTSQDPKYGLLTGGRIGREFSNGLSLSLGAYGGVERVETIETSEGRDYRGVTLLERKELESFINMQSAKLIGAEIGAGIGDYSVHFGRNLRDKFRVVGQYNFGGK